MSMENGLLLMMHLAETQGATVIECGNESESEFEK